MDVKTLIDEKTRFLFGTQNQITQAFPIIHVDQNFLYFTSTQALPQGLESGYMVAKDQAGIVTFDKPALQSLKDHLPSHPDVYVHRLDFDKINYSITNRRRAVRYEFKDYVPITFSVFGETIAAQILNISEGGLRMALDTPLKKNVRCHLQIRIPDSGHAIDFKTDGLVMYSDTTEGTHQHVAGISFVAPDFEGEGDEASYVQAQSQLKAYVDSKIICHSRDRVSP